MDVTGYNAFKEQHLLQFSPDTIELWKRLEAKESWTIEQNIEGVADIFEKLPKVCKYPLSDKTEQALSDLIGLIAYLPFIESISALAWCGFNSDEWGQAIYGYAYDTFSQSIITPELESNQAVIAAKTIVLRVEEVNRIAVMQTVAGRSI